MSNSATMDHLLEALERLEALSGRETFGQEDLLSLKEQIGRAIQSCEAPGRGDNPQWYKVFEHLGYPMCILDGNGIITYASDYYLALTNYTREQLIGRPEPFPEPVGEQVIRDRSPMYFGKNRTIHGTQVGLYVSATPLFAADGSVEHVVILLDTNDHIANLYQEMKKVMNKQDPIRIVADGEDPSAVPTRLLGTSRKMEEIRQQIRRVAPTDATVLITGESGCGKEMVADCVHSLSGRRDRPYVKINCAAIPPNLLEAELFGYERGAFTGANPKGKIGLFEAANTGTILLDEIGDFPMQLQPKLLRAIQQGEIFRVGGERPIKLDVRIIAATNCKLREKIKEGTFREDLYYRLNVFPILVPPLRERLEDVRVLISAFFHRYCEKYDKALHMSRPIAELLEGYNWPGNIRELQNVIEYYVICSDEETEMRLGDLRQVLNLNGDENDVLGGGKALYELRDNYEKRLIEQALMSTSNASQAAQLLGIYPSSLTRKMAKYNLHAREDPDDPDE